MKLNDEERRIMVNLEYEKALSFLEQAEKLQQWTYGMSLQTGCIIQYSMQCQHF